MDYGLWPLEHHHKIEKINKMQPGVLTRCFLPYRPTPVSGSVQTVFGGYTIFTNIPHIPLVKDQGYYTYSSISVRTHTFPEHV
jgi:hypothetical protein